MANGNQNKGIITEINKFMPKRNTKQSMAKNKTDVAQRYEGLKQKKNEEKS